MPKRTLVDGGEGTVGKRLETEPAVESDAKLEEFSEEISRSNFELPEIFHWVPVHILQEIFACLDILQAIKKCRCRTVTFTHLQYIISHQCRALFYVFTGIISECRRSGRRH